jgi:hypothetical protein
VHKVSDERGIVDSTLSAVVGVDCGGSGSRGCDFIRRRMVGGVVVATGGMGEKEGCCRCLEEGGNGDNKVDNIRASGTGDDGTVIDICID